MTDCRFPATLRIRRQADFDRVFAAKNYAADGVLVLHGIANGLPHSRLGLSVSRKVGTAVVRNRWKRLIRDIFRRSRAELPDGIDIVARPKAGALPDAAAIGKSFPALVRRLAKMLANRPL